MRYGAPIRCASPDVSGLLLKQFAARFWKRVRRTDGCWLWIGGTNANGYGVIEVGGMKRYAHRVAWELAHGRLEGGACVLHVCDNPQCVRPEHLRSGSQSDNARDMWSKGRAARAPRAKLTYADAQDIRARLATGATQTSIARAYGVGVMTINDIAQGRTWGEQ